MSDGESESEACVFTASTFITHEMKKRMTASLIICHR